MSVPFAPRTVIRTQFASETSNRPSSVTRGEWSLVVDMLKTHQITICSAETCGGDCPHKRGRSYNFAELRAGTTRSSENVVRVWVALFDLDDLTTTQARDLMRRLKTAGCSYVLSSTHSHRPGAPKLRLAFELNRPATAAEWSSLWASINARFDLRADPSTKDPARLYFEPTCPSDVKPLAWSQDGEPLDVDVLLLDAPAVAAARKLPLSGAEWVGLLENLGEGNRDNGLTQLAGLLIRDLPPALAEQLIHAVNTTWCKPPLSVKQVDKIVGSVARREAQRYGVAR